MALAGGLFRTAANQVSRGVLGVPARQILAIVALASSEAVATEIAASVKYSVFRSFCSRSILRTLHALWFRLFSAREERSRSTTRMALRETGLCDRDIATMAVVVPVVARLRTRDPGSTMDAVLPGFDFREAAGETRRSAGG